ncbi:SDR family oxidoreductase [Sphingobium sp.]|uniref:SDR family NAD(P)-dependent oxidoreductase n=1 Tax=Sphingobium sp. TaxID=1912891 RepID=UPI002CE599A1|nr:SDR family oxidoreductase [Sphingobium sp.]HUD92693.1 SDR family oxidoreductase [Sphingobium sp.]
MTGTNNPFADAHALLLGGAKGIGQALAHVFARRGAQVSVADIDLPAAQETAVSISEAGGKAQALSVNVLSRRSIADAVAQAQATFGPVDILLNNVGAILNGHPEDVPEQEWERIGELNYGAAVRGTREVLPAMLERGGGYIINTASFAGMYPYASTRIPYGAAKAAVINLSQNLALYCEPKGIRICCLLPGPVKTGIAASMTNWTPDAPLLGPGAALMMLTAEEAANRFADGIAEGRIMIASDDALWDIVRRWADDPDAFLHNRIGAVARGDLGVPGY